MAVAFSVALHGLVVAAGVGLLSLGWWSLDSAPRSPLTPPAPSSRIIDIELPLFHGDSEQDGRTDSPPHAPLSALPAGALVPRPDTGRDGRGGSDRTPDRAVNLADHDHGIRLARNLASHLDRDQIPRILSSALRESFENQRLTPRPMELTFLASGSGTRQERRPPADRDPSAGARAPVPADEKGADTLGRAPQPAGFDTPAMPAGGSSLGRDRSSPGGGVPDGSPGSDHRPSADVAFARPAVQVGAPSIPAPLSGSAKDNVDAAQQVAAVQQSLMDASTAGGRPGTGQGGQDGPGMPGFGGVDGSGSRSSPLGYGPGNGGWNGTDPMLSLYRRRIVAKIWPYWGEAFPRWARAEMRQGRVIIAVTILPDGSLRTAQIVRPSGIDEFDENCLRAVRRAAPFEPFPKKFPSSTLRWELSFDASNPVVR
jgi:TonB family protein